MKLLPGVRSQGFPQSIIASWYHDALNFHPDASVIPMMLFQMPWCFNKIIKCSPQTGLFTWKFYNVIKNDVSVQIMDTY